jgi:hypothetical protein
MYSNQCLPNAKACSKGDDDATIVGLRISSTPLSRIFVIPRLVGGIGLLCHSQGGTVGLFLGKLERKYEQAHVGTFACMQVCMVAIARHVNTLCTNM